MSEELESIPAQLLDASRSVFECYHRYENLRELTRHLNGLPDSAPLPYHVKIRKLVLDYTVNGLPHKAEVSSTELRVGDLYRLLARELENLVSEIRGHAATARSVAGTVEAGCTSAQYAADAQHIRGDM